MQNATLMSHVDTDLVTRARAKVQLGNELRVESLRVFVAFPPPGGAKAMTAEFRDALEVGDKKRENP